MSRTVLTASVIIAGLVSAVGWQPSSAGAADQLQLGVCDYAYGGPHDVIGSNPDLIATRFSLVVRDAPYEIDLDRLRRLNPDLVVLAYRDLGILPHELCSEPVAPLLPEMFLTDLETGNRLRIELPVAGRAWIMQPASAAWVSLAIDELSPWLDGLYDGVFLDDTWADLFANRPLPRQYGFDCSYGGRYLTYPQWVSQLNYLESMRSAIDAIASHFAPAPVIFNGLNDVPLVRELDYLAVASGATLEAPVYRERFTPDAPYRTGQSWRLAVKPMFEVASDVPIFWLGLGSPDSVAGRMYSLTSYLLGANRNTTFYFTSDCATLSYFPEWDVPITLNLGRPADLDDLWDPAYGIYIRHLAGALVMVDPRPSGEPIMVPVDPPMCRVTPVGGLAPIAGGAGILTLAEVSEVAIGPHEGVLLVDGPCTPPPRRPQQRISETE